MSFKKHPLGIALLLAALIAIPCGLYLYIVSGELVARQDPPAIETFLANRILDLSVPKKARDAKSPLGNSTADITAGRELYSQKCEYCHAGDGRGKTTAGSGLYPPPANLEGIRTQAKTDGELFYFIKNGIRNTGMPGWQLPDLQLWQLVAYVRNLPKTVSDEHAVSSGRPAYYIGSKSCKECHAAIYEQWAKTRMANVVVNPREHPEAILPDLSKPDSLVNFSIDDIAFVYGSKWKQRYFKKVGDDYFPLSAQWDVTHKTWRPYLAKEDWWAPLYPPDNFKRPTGPLCDGCHSVNYNPFKKTVSEWNVGCEKCHGPGSEHILSASRSNILNPARMSFVEASDTCIQCHSQGRPLENPVSGNYYDWPVGFEVGKSLSDYWKLEEHRLGQSSFYYFSDGAAHKNRMQGNDYTQSLMYTHGVSCFTCHDPHSSENNAMLRKPAAQLCLDCHGSKSPNGPFAPSIEAHTHHKPGSTGNQCIACHMPKIEQTIADVNVRSHTFHFVGPAKTKSEGIPNACNLCHADKSTDWAIHAMKNWKDVSPWRSGK